MARVNTDYADQIFPRSTATCEACGSDQKREFNGEIAIHFPGMDGLKKPIVWVFPKVYVCASCGLAEFKVPEKELSVLASEQTSPQD